MSLQVWMPLTKDYNNYGLSDLKFSTIDTTTSLTAMGKISEKCYTNPSYSGGGLISDKTINLGTKLSMFCWMRFTSLMPDSGLGGSMGGQHRYPTNTGMGLTIKYISASTGYLSVNTGNGSSRTYNTYCGSTLLNANTWYHVGFTYDGSTIRFYLNGKADGSHSYSGQSNPADYIVIGSWSLEGAAGTRTIHSNYKLYGYINDFRIYNHVLNLKEIKELSQGLAAHYQLKGMGKTNYLKGAGQYTEDHPLIRNASDTSVMNDSYVYYDTMQAIIPADGTYMWTLKSDGVPGGHPTSGTTASQRLFSMWLQNTSTGDHYHWDTGYTDSDGTIYSNAISLPAGTYKVRTNLYAADKVNYTVKIWDMKVIATPYVSEDIYCPHVDEMNGNIEMDCSGNGNNATKSAIFDIAYDSPRYDSCYIFPGSKSIACGRGPMLKDDMTVACWACADNWATFNGAFISCTEGGGWGMGYQATANGHGFELYANGEYYGVDMKYNNLSAGWHHFAATFDKNTLIGYVDGVEVARTTGIGAAIAYHASNGIFIGDEAGAAANASQGTYYYSGKMSDMRIYGTALSAADIAELYKVAATTNKQGQIRTYDFIEDKQKTSINKNGTITTGNIDTQILPLYDMKVKTLGDGTEWARIHSLNVIKDKTFFTTAEVTKCLDKSNRYSRMGIVDKYKSTSNDYEFMLTYPSMRKLLPSGYTQLEYIESTGTQWVNTGVTGAAKWEFDLQFTNTTTRQLMGYGGNGAEYWGCQTDGKYGLFAGSTIGVAGGRDTIVHDYTGSNSLWVQNQTMALEATDVTGKQYQIFTIMDAAGYQCKMKLWRCKCIQGTSLIRDFIPARRDSDGYVGLFDIVNSVFYGNSGSGSFVAGPTATEDIQLYNRWIQTSSPNATAVSGFKPITTTWTAHNSGIRKHGTDCVYNCDSGSTWYAPVGQIRVRKGGIPAADGTIQTQTELWVRVDRVSSSNADKFKIYDGSIAATDFIEI